MKIAPFRYSNMKDRWRLCVFANTALPFAISGSGLAITLYQMCIIIDGFIREPTVTRVLPIQNRELPRPDIVVCKNMYLSYLNKNHKYLNPNVAVLIASLNRDYSVFLRYSMPSFMNMSADIDPEIATNITQLVNQFRSCNVYMNYCNVVKGGLSNSDPWKCCDGAKELVSPRDICYQVQVNESQFQEGKSNSVIMELLFTDADSDYLNFYLYTSDGTDHDERFAIQPTTKVHAMTEVQLAITLRQRRVLNSTHSQCASNKNLVTPVCTYDVLLRFVRQNCKCDAYLPFWAETKNTTTRQCEFLEEWKCMKLFMAEMYEEVETALNECHSTVCEEMIMTVSQTVTNVNDYVKSFGSPESARYSLVYIFYGSLTTTIEEETKMSTWTTVLSALGGIWGLWMGWSVRGIANFIIVMLGRVAKASIFKTEKSTGDEDEEPERQLDNTFRVNHELWY